MDGTVSALEYVNAPINYLDGHVRPVAYMYDPPPGVPQRSGQQIGKIVQVRNARPIARDLSLDREGFLLTEHETSISNFYDDRDVKARYYPEVERLVKSVTGATRVIVFDHNVRHAPAAQRALHGAKEPVKRAHNDYTSKSGWQRARDLLSAGEAARLLQHRFAVINVWRPIAGPVLESPLAVCDARSIAPADLVPTDLVYRDRTGETYSLAFNPDHQWFYFPRQRRNEALLIKCFDSSEDGRARFAAHSAFDDPASPADAPPRQSIEARTFAFFAPGA